MEESPVPPPSSAFFCSGGQNPPKRTAEFSVPKAADVEGRSWTVKAG
jgi:hypothetical protein